MTFVKTPKSGFYFSSKFFFRRKELRKSPKRDAYSNLLLFNRIVTSSGVYLFENRTSTIPKKELTQICDNINYFFDKKIEQFKPVYEDNIEYLVEQGFPRIDLDGVENAQDIEVKVREMAKRYPDSPYELALYAYRSLNVEHPEAYVKAALRDYKTAEKAQALKDISDAIRVVKSIKNNESIFASDDRIMLPDEVLLFKTGSHRDKALLLYSLINHAHQIPLEEKEGRMLVFTDKSSYVHVGGWNIDTKTFLCGKNVVGNEIHRFNERMNLF